MWIPTSNAWDIPFLFKKKKQWGDAKSQRIKKQFSTAPYKFDETPQHWNQLKIQRRDLKVNLSLWHKVVKSRLTRVVNQLNGGGCYGHACPKDDSVLLVRVSWQGRQPIEWGRMSRSCMSKACCQWPHDKYPNLACPWLHARSKPLLHAFIPDRSLLTIILLFHIYIYIY